MTSSSEITTYIKKKKSKLKNRRDLVNEVKSRAEKRRMKLILMISEEHREEKDV